MAVGVILLLSACAKAYDLEGSAVLAQASYPGLPSPTLVVIGLVVLEIGLSGGLILLSSRLPVFAAAAFLIAMTAVALWGMSSGASSCGCFGTMLELPPAVTLVKNAIMLGLLAVAAKVPGESESHPYPLDCEA